MTSHDDFEAIAALHAVGAATDEERTALLQHLATCSSCAAALDEYGEAATLMATSLEPVTPPAEVRQELLDAVRKSKGITRPAMMNWWLAAAASLLLVLWGIDEIRIRRLRGELGELRAEKSAAERRNERLAGTLRALSSPDTRTFSLAGQDVAPTASARVFLDAPNRRAFVFFHGLPPNAGDKSYQLWIIRADTPQPQPAGTFDVDAGGSAQLSVENLPVGVELKALAVTLEQRGGVPAPTGKMYLVGTTG